MGRKKIIFKVVTILVVVATLAFVIYIMANHLGLNENLDFGAGAYYYADIPNFEELVNGEEYQAKMPLIIYIILFLVWGFLMYKLWTWIDRH